MRGNLEVSFTGFVVCVSVCVNIHSSRLHACLCVCVPVLYVLSVCLCVQTFSGQRGQEFRSAWVCRLHAMRAFQRACTDLALTTVLPVDRWARRSAQRQPTWARRVQRGTVGSVANGWPPHAKRWCTGALKRPHGMESTHPRAPELLTLLSISHPHSLSLLGLLHRQLQFECTVWWCVLSV